MWSVWTGFTLYANVAGTRTRLLSMLAAMFGIAVMAASVPQLEHGEPAVFIIAYVVISMIQSLGPDRLLAAERAERERAQRHWIHRLLRRRPAGPPGPVPDLGAAHADRPSRAGPDVRGRPSTASTPRHSLLSFGVRSGRTRGELSCLSLRG